MKLNTDSFVGVGICVLGLLGVGYAIGVRSRMKAVCDKLDTSIERLANDTEVDILFNAVGVLALLGLLFLIKLLFDFVRWVL